LPAIELLPAVSAMIVATSQRRWKMVRASMTFWIRYGTTVTVRLQNPFRVRWSSPSQ